MTSKIHLLSDDDVDKIAKFDITDNCDLYDPRFGSAGSIEVVCQVCNMRGDVCMGHHASLSLGKYMFHPMIYKDAERIINSKCFKCLEVFSYVSKSRKRECPNCGSVNPGDYVVYEKNLTAASKQNKSSLINANKFKQGFFPNGYVISKILVPPIYLRTPENMEWPSEIHRLYDKLVNLIKSKKNTEACLMYQQIISSPNKKGIVGIMSGKGGIFRNIMMGKRVELSARAVVVGDPSIMLDEVAVPKVISESVKMKVTCNLYNIRLLKNLAEEKMLWWENTDDNVDPQNIFIGMQFHRKLQDGDLVLLNRQPSLSRFSLMCFRVRIRSDSYNVIGINPQVTSPFNADFDGDEMNLFFMLNKAEMLELCHVSKCITTDDGSHAVIQPVQDLVTGCYLMSCNKSQPITKSLWCDYVQYRVEEIQSADISKDVYAQYHVGATTEDILNMYIPEYNGGLITKKDIMKIICNFNDYRALRMLYVLQLVTTKWLSTYGLTIPIRSVVATPVVRQDSEDPDAFRERCQNRVHEELNDTSLMSIIKSGAKGSIIHASHMAVAIGQQYIRSREGVFCNESYLQGLTPDNFFGHQMAAREGVVSTGISTASTGYLNRRACKTIADLTLKNNQTVADKFGVSSFRT